MRLFKRIIFLSLFGLLSLSGAVAQQSTLTPQILFKQIDAEGANKVLDRLVREKLSSDNEMGADPFPTSENWLYMMKKIQQGDAAWLEMARILGSAKISIVLPTGYFLDAIILALPNNPAGVLSLLTARAEGSLKVGEVCTHPHLMIHPSITAPPFVTTPSLLSDEDDPVIIAKLQADHLRRAEAALVKFKAPPSLQKQRLACLENIQAQRCMLSKCKTPVLRQHRAAWNQAPPPTHPALTAQSVLQNIEKQGPEAVVARLWNKNQGRNWYVMLGNIDQGDAAWLDVAYRLTGGAGAIGEYLDEDIENAVDRALPRAPRAVLEYIRRSQYPTDRALSTYTHCRRLPYPDGFEEEANLQYVHHAETAVLAVDAPEVEREKQFCLQELQALRPRRRVKK